MCERDPDNPKIVSRWKACQNHCTKHVVYGTHEKFKRCLTSVNTRMTAVPWEIQRILTGLRGCAQQWKIWLFCGRYEPSRGRQIQTEDPYFPTGRSHHLPINVRKSKTTCKSNHGAAHHTRTTLFVIIRTNHTFSEESVITDNHETAIESSQSDRS